jgi:carnitine-CoA ligase
MTDTTNTYRGITFTFPDRESWTLPAVLAHRVVTHGDKTYLVEGEGARRRWTYRELDRDTAALAAGLRARGFAPGDRLAIMMGNCPEYVLVWYAAARLGVVEAPVNPDYTGGFLEHAVNLTTPHGVVTSTRHAAAFVDARVNLPANLRFFVVGEDAAGWVERLESCGWAAEPFSALFARTEPVPRVELSRRDLAAIISTGGTTGLSKGVMMSHSHFHFFAEQLVNAVRLTEQDTYLLASPLFHGMAQFLTAYPVLVTGGTVVMYERFSPSRFVDRLHDSGATVTNLIGVMTDWVWKQPPTERDGTHRLRRILCAPTPASIAEPFRARFGLEAIVEVYGQTETSMNLMCPYGGARPPGAVGLVVDEFFEVRVADPVTDEELPVGVAGELQVRSKEPWIMNSGYWGMPEATAAARRNLWFHTGDALKRDADGWFYFTDRLKDTIRRRGENISSFEVEQVIAANPGVLECAVYAVDSEVEGGEDEVMAAVVLAPGTAYDDLVTWSSGRMPALFVPRYWRTMPALPKGPSERVQKDQLRKAAVTADTYDRDRP